MTAPPASESVSECVARHASAFVRKWPEAHAPAVVTPTPPKTALEFPVTELEDNRSKRVQAVKAAEGAGWSWRAQHASSPSEPRSFSVVLRFALEDEAAGVTRRAVGYWSARPDRDLAWVAGFVWDERHGGACSDFVRVSGTELLPHLRRGGVPLPPESSDQGG